MIDFIFGVVMENSIIGCFFFYDILMFVVVDGNKIIMILSIIKIVGEFDFWIYEEYEDFYNLRKDG